VPTDADANIIRVITLRRRSYKQQRRPLVPPPDVTLGGGHNCESTSIHLQFDRYDHSTTH